MKVKKIYKEKEAINIFKQLLSALKVLVKEEIIHRDIKPENILFNKGKLKLADFGFCMPLKKGDLTRIRVGSPIYMAPEILRDQFYDNKCDIYSMGVVLYELLFGRAPYEDSTLTGLKN